MNTTELYNIEVSVNYQGQFFDITPMGKSEYKISIAGETLGTIQMETKDEDQSEILEMPQLQAIREVIQYHERWAPQKSRLQRI